MPQTAQQKLILLVKYVLRLFSFLLGWLRSPPKLAETWIRVTAEQPSHGTEEELLPRLQYRHPSHHTVAE